LPVWPPCAGHGAPWEPCSTSQEASEPQLCPMAQVQAGYQVRMSVVPRARNRGGLTFLGCKM
jgi:hypothetical protein